VLRNFRSYALFIEQQWCARGLPRLLCLLALLGGAGAIAGEREAHTWPLVYRSGVPLRSVVLVKYLVLATWLKIVCVGSIVVLALHTLIARLPFPLVPVLVTVLIAYLTSLAFLAVVFAAGAFVGRTVAAGGIALVAGFAVAGLLTLAGFNGTALGADVFASDGSLLAGRVVSVLLVCLALTVVALGLALFEVDRRRAA
jgi:ABC-type transport system involved in multi-copper enzyme maturation permease subunit